MTEPILNLRGDLGPKKYGRNQLAKNILNKFFFLSFRGGPWPLPVPIVPSLERMATLFLYFCFRFCLDSNNSVQPPPSLWLFTLPRCSFSSSIFWLCQFSARVLRLVFSEANPCFCRQSKSYTCHYTFFLGANKSRSQ
jgi:hypothetical protein